MLNNYTKKPVPFSYCTYILLSKSQQNNCLFVKKKKQSPKFFFLFNQIVPLVYKNKK